MARKKITLKDIAASLNVSITTVYRALNGHPDISQKLKDQIQFIASELNYHPNLFAQSLRKRQSHLLGVIVPKITNYFSSTVISGMIKTANEKNYRVIISETRNQYELEKANLQHLINSGVDGIMIAISNNTFREDHLDQLIEEEIPFVFFDKVPDQIAGPKVLTNDYKGAFTATEHLVKQGYKNIAHIKGQRGSRNAMPRFNGYKDALLKHKIPFNEKLVIECQLATEAEGYDYALQLMKLKTPPDAFFTINDETAIGVLAALRKLKIKVPDKVGVVGFCNLNVAAYTEPSLTSVEQYGFDIGKIAVEMLLEIIASTTKETILQKEVVIEPKLIIRSSSKRK